MSKDHLPDELMKKIGRMCRRPQDATIMVDFARECFSLGWDAALEELAAAVQEEFGTIDPPPSKAVYN